MNSYIDVSNHEGEYMHENLKPIKLTQEALIEKLFWWDFNEYSSNS